MAELSFAQPSRPQKRTSQGDASLDDSDRPKQTIKRNRKITSCFQCREKKQKCNRAHPVCGECAAANGECTYVSTIEEVEALRSKRVQSSDGAILSEAGEASSSARSTSTPNDLGTDSIPRSSASTVFGGNITEARSTMEPLTDSDLFCTGPSTSAGLLQMALNHQNNGLVSDVRVRAVRAEAVAQVLTAITMDIPPLDAVRELLNIFHTRVAWFCDAAIPDLFWPRIEPLLDWWYAGRQGLPADPVLLPLLATMLAIGLQAKRTSDPNIPQDWGPNHVIVEGCSSEGTLLLSASMMTTMLQMHCPASWAIAYSAPLDLVRVCLLRALWQLAEHNLQLASTLIASTIKLAQSAGLHRDPVHWKGIHLEETYIRRNLWQNVCFLEIFISNRLGQPPGLVVNRSDTSIPDGPADLERLFAKLPPDSLAGKPPPPPPRSWSEYHTHRFRVAQLLLEQNSCYFGIKPPSKEIISQLSPKYEAWREALPDILSFTSDTVETESITGHLDERDEGDDTLFFQRKMLELIFLHGQTSIRRPFLEADLARNEQTRPVLERCLSSSKRMVKLVLQVMSRNPPYLILNIMTLHLFNASVILAAYAQPNEPSDKMLFLILQTALEQMSTIASTPRWHAVARQAGTYIQTIKQLMSVARQRAQAAADTKVQSDGVRQQGQQERSQGQFPSIRATTTVQRQDDGTSTSTGWPETQWGNNHQLGNFAPPSTHPQVSLSGPPTSALALGTMGSYGTQALRHTNPHPQLEPIDRVDPSGFHPTCGSFGRCFGMCQNPGRTGATGGCGSSTCPQLDETTLRGGPSGFSLEWLALLNNNDSAIFEADRPLMAPSLPNAFASTAVPEIDSLLQSNGGASDNPQMALDALGFLRYCDPLMGPPGPPPSNVAAMFPKINLQGPN
ncbi:unnamed protein product [Tilletia controversa]|uniref:Zn(2)-C6 fungal-type domain-containing protein n=3 Tax=Tilletia TaxID=13289 RepID=A0A8X7SW10_9BASI|nr:hypothetical protein CF336_g3990 [Tilletia laevis]KAE8195224.1 hypothetical protein CF328_g4503 [Tilletia controversa]KAE8259235.1 hypothetical protein A4X03_0g4149 [Tilletia caries]KAE8199058.1 hypothetical protein CF335_g4252 [Tilletia laevis]KAE8246005.1 hypothetical protein A4X06_0g5261 [Tilletia controversa]